MIVTECSLFTSRFAFRKTVPSSWKNCFKVKMHSKIISFILQWVFLFLTSESVMLFALPFECASSVGDDRELQGLGMRNFNAGSSYQTWKYLKSHIICIDIGYSSEKYTNLPVWCTWMGTLEDSWWQKLLSHQLRGEGYECLQRDYLLAHGGALAFL